MKFRTLLYAACLLTSGLAAPFLYAQNFTFTSAAGATEGAVDGLDAGARFYNPTGVAVDGGGNVYVADQKNNLIRKISPLGTDWVVTTIAGGAQGSLDGANSSAQFFGPTGIAVDGVGNLYLADQNNSVIRRITLSGTNWIVTTIAGTAGVFGSQNGTNGGASFFDPAGIAVDGAGNLFVADEGNNSIREITPSGTNWIVTTIAGGSRGSADGTNLSAQFSSPIGVAVDSGGRIFVADQFNNTIRLITPLGTNWVVTTIAGQTIAGRSDGLGTNALFDTPLGVAVDFNNNIYVADGVNNAIRKLASSGATWLVSTIGGGSQGTNNGTGTNASFYLPFSVAADAYGDIFVADSENNTIRFGVAAGSPAPTGGLQVAITPSGAVSAGAGWRLDGGPLQTSGATLAGLGAGTHTISFTNVAGFTTPAMQTVLVTARQTTPANGNYPAAIANAGSLQVILSPAGAANAGAQWRADSGASLQTNAAIVAGLSVGTHTISFTGLPGWTTPPSQTITITNGQTTLGSGIYTLQTGSLLLTILPSNVVGAGAQWRVNGGTLQAGGTTLTGLPPGDYTIGFNTVLGWQTPPNIVVSITNTLTTYASATYTHPPVVSGMIVAGGGFQFALSGQIGSNYVIQASTDLSGWTPLSTNTIPAGGYLMITDSNMPSHLHRFYRAAAVSISPPQINGMTLNHGTAQFILNGQAGSRCVIQASSNLSSWSAILTNTIPAAGALLITDPEAASQKQRFYRATGL